MALNFDNHLSVHIKRAISHSDMTSKQNWNFRSKGEGRSGRRPLLPKRNVTF